MAGITLNDLFSMTQEQLINASNKQSFYTDKQGREHMVLNFPDDDIPEDVQEKLNAIFEEDARILSEE